MVEGMKDLLNEAQYEAVTHGDKPALVLAGPGSGKTTVITWRIKYLIEECHVKPASVMVVTFTRAAAIEMKERYEKMSDGRGSAVTFGTFHSIFFRILKMAYNYNPEHIISEAQKVELIKGIMKETDAQFDDEKEVLPGIISEISLVKGNMIDINNFYSSNCPENTFRDIYNEYEKRMRQENKIDFDDMLILCYELLTARKDILELWRQRYQYILVDEYQDINVLQYRVLKLLSPEGRGLFAVGDDDQSIYRFRGAKPEIMLGFERDFPGAKMYLLDVNYRSAEDIVGLSLKLIGNNEKRFKKGLKAFRKEAGNVFYREYDDIGHENAAIVKIIKRMADSGYDEDDIAVLYRTNNGSSMLIKSFIDYGIPFVLKDKINNIFEHWIAQDLIAYVRLAMGQTSRENVLRIINRPNRYVPRRCFTEPEVSFEKLKEMLSDKEWMVERIEKLEYDLLVMRRISPYAAIQYIRKGIGYEEFLSEYAKKMNVNEKELMDILDEIHESAGGCAVFNQWFDKIQEYGEKLKEQAAKRGEKQHGVTVCTMHSAKGLEYRTVFVPDVNEGVIPYRKAVIDADIEEERRLLYVALTRAKDRLYVMSTKERYNKEADRSRFIEEMFED